MVENTIKEYTKELGVSMPRRLLGVIKNLSNMLSLELINNYMHLREIIFWKNSTLLLTIFFPYTIIL